MKKYIYLIATLFLLGGCTLSMEDWVTPEEDRGKDEPYTVESEYGTITYQFADSVLYVTDKVQEDYIVRVEHDSILYFNGNVPQKFRPYKGMKMATGCSHLLPYGLNHKVLSVEDVGGILKVVTTKVSTEEVYEHLSYKIDYDIVAPDLSGMTAEELEDYGYEMTINEAGDTVIMDWNEYDVEKGIRPASAKRRSLKRSMQKSSGMRKEKRTGDKEEETTYIDLLIDTRDIAVKDAKSYADQFRNGLVTSILGRLSDESAKVPSRTKELLGDPYVGVGLKVVNHQLVHAEEDTDIDYELKYTDTWTEWEARIEAGFTKSFLKSKDEETDVMGIPDAAFFSGLKNTLKEKQSLKNLAKESTKWSNGQLRIMLTATPVPIAFIASATFSPILEISGNICGSVTYTTDKVRTGYEIKNGEKYDIKDEIIEKSHWSAPKFVLSGAFKAGASFRAAAGIEVAATIGVTVGANVEGGFEANGSIGFDTGNALDDDEETSAWKPEGELHFYVDFYGDVQLHVAPLGFHLWDKELARFLTKHIVNVTTKLAPQIDFTSGTTKFGKELGEDYSDYDQIGLVRGFYKVRSMDGVGAFLSLNPMRYPGMRLYFGPVSDNNWIFIKPYDANWGDIESMSQWKSAENGNVYNFEWVGTITDHKKGEDPITEVTLVPTLYSYKSYFNPLYAGKVSFEDVIKHIGDEIVMKDNACRIELADPDITTLEAGQIEGVWNGDYDFASHEQGGYVSTEDGEHGGQSVYEKPSLRRYTIYTRIKIDGGTRMKEWGLKIYIFGPDGKKRLLRRKLPVNKLRSGTYTFIFNFESDWGTKQSIDTSKEHLYFRIQPYWSDPRASDLIEAQDAASLKKYPIDWEMEDTKSEEILGKDNGSKWGTVSQQNLHDY